MRPFALFLVFGAAVLTGCPLPGSNLPSDTAQTVLGAQYGENCGETDDCADPLVCAYDHTCLNPGEPGTSSVGDDCASTAFCRTGLVCASNGQCAVDGSPGTLGSGEDCDESTDCRLGYSCLEGQCFGYELPLWLGASCTDDELGAFRVIFEVPETGAPAGDDFYRLPFPNDARVHDGVLDMSGHPVPGVLIPQLGDVVGEVIDGLIDDFDGFGTNQAVLLRFSERADFTSLELGLPPDDGTIGLVGLTPGSPDYGDYIPTSMKAVTGRGAYICANWIGLAPGRPLRPGETYAALVGEGVESNVGSPVTRDDDFTALLDDNAPSDVRLEDAWDAYAPLRAWVAATGRHVSDFSAVAVFTTQDPTRGPSLVRAAVEAEPLPTATTLVVCDTAAGPYADSADPTRGCDGTDALFSEVQGTLTLPSYQTGTPPFKDRDDGGAIDLSSGAPAKVADEDVVFGLTIPSGSMPSAGWPLVIYGHGTGGNYRSAVSEGLAGALSSVLLDDGTTVKFATLTIDALHHGPRRHEENWDATWLLVDPDAYAPDVLFYNPLNPRAARDNGLQSSADYWMVSRWAEAMSWTTSSPTGSPVRFDDNHIYYLGHSQGASSGTVTLAYSEEFDAAVLSAAGGLLVQTLLNKTSPHDLGAMIGVGIGEHKLDRYHPLLNLAQMGAERSDGVNHAIYVVREPWVTSTPVFQIYGVDDTYTPNKAQAPLARQLGVDQIIGDEDPLASIDVITAPATANGPYSTTAVVGLYAAPGAADAHFVLFDRDDTLRQATHFFGTAVRDGMPTVVTPTQ